MAVSEAPNAKEVDRPVLLPKRHPNHDLFICDVLDAIPKDDLGSMEHPVFSLATRPDTRILKYEHRNVKIQITPSVKGLATIFDKDLLIYCISQMITKKNQGQPLAPNHPAPRPRPPGVDQPGNQRQRLSPHDRGL